jgi:site-specific DNA-methyltransferase (cytosine-N4-specific)
VFEEELAERCILLGCKPGGTVLDPFAGTSTTGMAAVRHDRSYVGIEIVDEWKETAKNRLLLARPGLSITFC